jgi:hypothetical protein
MIDSKCLLIIINRWSGQNLRLIPKQASVLSREPAAQLAVRNARARKRNNKLKYQVVKK